MPQLRRDVSTALTRRPDAPQISLKSPFAGDAHMGDIIVEGDPFFVKHGSIIIERGAIELYRFVSDGERLNPTQIKIQTSGTLWNQNERINVWVWSRTGDTVKLSIHLNVDLRPIPPTSAVLPPNRAELLQFAPDNNPLKNTAQTFIEWLRSRLDGVADPALRADLAAFTESGFSLGDRDAMVPRLDGNPEIRDRLAALNESLPIPDYSGSAMFPLKVYTDEDHARLVHMRGARNGVLILTHDPPAEPMLVSTEERGFTETPIAFIRPDEEEYGPESGFAFDRVVWKLNPDLETRGVSMAVSLSTSARISGGLAVRRAGDADPPVYDAYRGYWSGTRRTLIVEGAADPAGPWTEIDRYTDPAKTQAPTTSRTFAIADGHGYEYFRAGAEAAEYVATRSLGAVRRELFDGRGTFTYTTKALSTTLMQSGVSAGFAPSVRLELKGPDGDWAELSPYVKFPGVKRAADRPSTEMAGESHFFGQDLGNAVLPTGPDILRLRLKSTPPTALDDGRNVYPTPARARVLASWQSLA